MRSQSSAEPLQHRKTEKDGEACEEDEDEYGVRMTVKKFNPREPCKEGRGARENACAVPQLVPALR